MSIVYPQPKFQAPSFQCPHCGAHAQMDWAQLHIRDDDPYEPTPSYVRTRLHQSICFSCKQPALWRQDVDDIFGTEVAKESGKLLHPQSLSSPLPHADLPSSCRADYDEARQIAEQSPRGAAALLRLCIQKICTELGRPETKIDQAIKALVAQGLPVQLQQALDTVRVIGNEAVHPGEMSARDHAEQVHILFSLVNIIVEQMITQPKKIAEIYGKLPQSKRDGITERDRPKG